MAPQGWLVLRETIPKNGKGEKYTLAKCRLPVNFGVTGPDSSTILKAETRTELVFGYFRVRSYCFWVGSRTAHMGFQTSFKTNHSFCGRRVRVQAHFDAKILQMGGICFGCSWTLSGLPGPPVVPFYPFLGEGSPTKID